MKTVTQHVLPLGSEEGIEPGSMTCLVLAPDRGGVVVINEMVAYTLTSGDEVGR